VLFVISFICLFPFLLLAAFQIIFLSKAERLHFD